MPLFASLAKSTSYTMIGNYAFSHRYGLLVYFFCFGVFHLLVGCSLCFTILSAPVSCKRMPRKEKLFLLYMYYMLSSVHLQSVHAIARAPWRRRWCVSLEVLVKKHNYLPVRTSSTGAIVVYRHLMLQKNLREPLKYSALTFV